MFSIRKPTAWGLVTSWNPARSHGTVRAGGQDSLLMNPLGEIYLARTDAGIRPVVSGLAAR